MATLPAGPARTDDHILMTSSFSVFQKRDKYRLPGIHFIYEVRLSRLVPGCACAWFLHFHIFRSAA